MSNQTPSVRPADESSLIGVINTAVDKALQRTDGMLPVEVVSYDRATNRATVRHLVQMVGSDGEVVSRAEIASIRVQQPGNGAFSISLPIQPGDKGWLLAADRDISNFQQGLTESQPNTDRKHSFQDGLFMPDAMGLGDVPGGSAESGRVVLGSNDGAAFLSFDASGLYFTAPGVTVSITAAGVEITGPGLSVLGGSVTHNGVNIGDTHVHGGVTVGAATTLVPE